MKAAFALVALLVAVICTHDELQSQAFAAPKSSSHHHHHKRRDQVLDKAAEMKIIEKAVALDDDEPQVHKELDPETDPFEEELRREAKHGSRARRQAMMSSSDSMSMSSSGDSMSMSSDDGGGGAAGGAAGGAGNTLVGQLQEPELMLTGEMLRRLEEQTLGYSSMRSSASSVTAPHTALLSVLWCLLSMLGTYLLLIV